MLFSTHIYGKDIHVSIYNNKINDYTLIRDGYIAYGNMNYIIDDNYSGNNKDYEILYNTFLPYIREIKLNTLT